MIQRPTVPRFAATGGYRFWLIAGGVAASFFALSTMAPAGVSRLLNLPGSHSANAPDSNNTTTSQTSTAATTSVSQTAQTIPLIQRAQAALLKSTQSLQNQQAAQTAARNLALSGSNNVAAPLHNVPNGLAPFGLVPGMSGTDTIDPSTVVVTLPVTTNASGASLVTVAKGTALTLPTNITGNEQIMVSGTGTVGTVTTGGTIKPLTGGVTTAVAPGSTINLTSGGTVTFTGGSPGAIPTSVTTYNYGTKGLGVPDSWTGIGGPNIAGLSQSVYAPVAGQTEGQTTVTITQTQQQALLTWQTFNIGKNTILDFDQSAGGSSVGNWVAINKVAANIAPSQILGAIQAPGQVYVVNQNGIIFGGSSQVNTHALVVSSLPINENLVERGLLNNPDEQFLFSQIDQPSGALGPTPALPAPAAPTSGLVSKVDAAGNLSIVAANGQDGDVTVQKGAQLSSPTSAIHVGGKIALIGPNVSNAGTITTPDGQAILAAGDQVGFVSHASSDPSLRGLDVFVGSVDASSGTVSNTGLLESPRADVTMVGKNVNQNGIIDSSTSVSLNGRIDLLADYNAVVSNINGTVSINPTQTGDVSFGEDSLTQILPEWASTDKVVGTQLALPSLVNVQGKTIHMLSDAMLLAPGAEVSTAAGSTIPLDMMGTRLTSGVTFNAGNWLPNNGVYTFASTGGQVYLDSGSTIDVSGSQDVSASVADNIISVQLLGSQLANSPLQREGALRGQTIQIDLSQYGNYNGTEWVGTPLADTSGYINLIERTVGELTTNGGTVAINSGGSVVAQAGSTVNVSGGWINYQGANVQTTKVVSNGQIYDISLATPDRVYSGIYNGYNAGSIKWNFSQKFASSLLQGTQYEAGYLQGGNGGSLSIQAPAVALDGNLYGNTVAGSRQRQATAQVASNFSTNPLVLPTMTSLLSVPLSSSLSLSFSGKQADGITPLLTSPNVTFVTDSDLAQNPVATVPAFSLDNSGNPVALPTSRQGNVYLSQDLVNNNGFGTLNIDTSASGTIKVAADVALNAAPGTGSISLSGANIDIEGDITAPGGSLAFKVSDISPYALYILGLSPSATTPAPDPTRGKFKLGSGASLSTAGLVIDDRATSATAGSLPLALNGGQVSITSYQADLLAGSSVNVSGGVEVNASGKLSYGSGGNIAISAGTDSNIPSIGQSLNTPSGLRGYLAIDSSLQGYSGGTGGSLNIHAPLIQIGGTAADPSNTLLLSPDFFSKGVVQGTFSEGGFTTFTLNAIGEAAVDSNGHATGQFIPGVSVATGTKVDLKAESWQTSFNGNNIILTPTLFPNASQRTPVSLSLSASGLSDTFSTILLDRGDVVVGAGSLIQTDPKGSVTLSGQTVAVLGSIIAPGGSISVKGAKDSTTLLFSDSTDAVATVDLGANSLLSTAGTTEYTPNAYGTRTGTVLSGGKITVDGNIVAEAGAVLDVSGASAILDLSPASAGVNAIPRPSATPVVVATQVDSNGGSITLKGEQELFTDATLLGAAGGSSAQGGSLNISSGLFSLPNVVETPLDSNLIVSQSGLAIAKPFYPADQTAIGHAVVDANGAIIRGEGFFSIDNFDSLDNHTKSGFDSLTLGGKVRFSGPVAINAQNSLNVGDSGVIFADSAVTLTASYVKLGQAFQGPLTVQQQQLQEPFQANGGPFAVPPVYGNGSLTANASLIDIGNLSLQNIGNANFIANNGDVRGDGTLDVAGHISITAGQVYPPTQDVFTIAAYDYFSGGKTQSGTVTIAASGTRQLPLSAGGTLNIYSSIINQGGVLRAPLGTINLGYGVTGSVPHDVISGQNFNATQTVTLASGSITSVSAVDPVTHQDLTIPYGIVLNGVSWIDPSGTDITAGGVPAKNITISAANVIDQAGATIDIKGGGDLLAYRFVPGLGGTSDILASTTSYAIVPGYNAGYAPNGAYNTSSAVFGADTGYANNTLAVGQQVYLAASNGLPAGFYTLLPARYALMPGAFLVTAKNGLAPTGPTVVQADGSRLVSGYLSNGFSSQTSPSVMSVFEVDPQSVVKARAEYDISSANGYFGKSALANNTAVPRLPQDAGQLVLAATQTMTLKGTVTSQTPVGGLGSLVDIASPSDILIAGPNTDLSQVAPGTLVLDSSSLTAFGADSLLIGGFRQITSAGTEVAVTTDRLTVDNQGAPLSGPDVILTSNGKLTFASNSIVQQSGSLSSPAETLLLGNATPGSGDGTLVRVISDVSAQILRSGVNPEDATPSLVIGSQVTLSGASLTLDSTHSTTLDAQAILNGTAVSIDSGQVSLVLNNPGSLQPTTGLVLSGSALQTLQAAAQDLSLLSYSSIDIYGNGQIGGLDAKGKPLVKSLTLHGAGIRGFNAGGGAVVINAQDVSIDNSINATMPALTAPLLPGTLDLNANTVHLGANGFRVQGYSTTEMTTTGGIVVQGTGGFSTAGDLVLDTPLLTGVASAHQTITANGALTISSSSGTGEPTVTPGLNSNLTLVGQTVTDNGDIALPSGSLTLHATGGDVQVGNLSPSLLDVSGVPQPYFDLTKYTSGGQVTLTSDTGSVDVSAGSTINVSAPAGGGNAGSLTVNAQNGNFAFASNTLNGQADGGQGGTFSLDTKSIPGGSLNSLDTELRRGGFNQSITIRDRKDANVLVDGLAKTASYNLSVDQGSITVSGTIDASNVSATDSLENSIKIGGTINLEASGSVTLLSGSLLDVSAAKFNNAGKGGAVTIAAGSETNGVAPSTSASRQADGTFASGTAVIDLQTGSKINLSVAANNGTSAAAGDYTGTLHLRAPQTTSATDLQINPLNGQVIGASSIVVEGYKIYTPAGGAITSTVESSILANGNSFVGVKGQPASAGYTAMLNHLIANNTGLASSLVIVPGAEIVNPTGNLTLASDWDLSTYRFGPKSAPGVLTLRAAGNLVFNGALSDGFTAVGSPYAVPQLYQYSLMAQNAALPANVQSWSYQLTAGSDFNAANINDVQSLATLQNSGLDGSLKLGKNDPTPYSTAGGNALTSSVVKGFYQVIRTGTGDINIATGNDVELLNQFATIYTAGVAAAPLTAGTFDTPILNITGSPASAQGAALGIIQESPFYPVQYSVAGGNVVIAAQHDILHETQDSDGNLVADSELQLPNNWLDRRGYVDPATGQFGATKNGDIGSTSWWVDFSNFFEGIGTLGGGNVTLAAGNNITNVDAVVATNARTTKVTATGDKLAAHQTTVELGGGDLAVHAGNNIDGGVYYVERGQGTIQASNDILTNITRAPTLSSTVAQSSTDFAPQTWLPTTLFLGKGGFDVSAGNNLLLGPVANTFLLPQGVNNTFWDKTYFSTYAQSDSITVSSLSGNVTLQEAATLPGIDQSTPLLVAWLQNISLFALDGTTQSYYQPWLRLSETDINPFGSTGTVFGGVSALMPGTLKATAFSGDINTIGSLTLSPSQTGTIDFVAAGSINGVQINGINAVTNENQWSSTSINLSDADPANIPGINSPYAYQVVAGTNLSAARETTSGVVINGVTIGLDLSFINNLFDESGSTEGNHDVLQTKQALHADINNQTLHATDTTPVHLYTQDGDISGITLFSGKATRVIAGQDVTDIALYLQNNNINDVSLVSAGRDIIAYDTSAPLLVAAQSVGNVLNAGEGPLAGDIQIGGPGTLEVLAGRNLNLGVGPNNDDGTGVGITSIGNARNPNLHFDSGASIIGGAGIGTSSGLGAGQMNFGNISIVDGIPVVDDPASFIAKFLSPDTAGAEAERYLPDLATLMGLPSDLTNQQVWAKFGQLPKEKQDSFALDIFYLALRDSGRDHNAPTTPGSTAFSSGLAAIAALFPGSANSAVIPDGSPWRGDISLTSREIKTTDGGDINLFAPGGSLTVGFDVAGNQPVDQGILTEDGGNISIFTHNDVVVGTSRIFTLHGGNEIIWSSYGDIAAGSASKTVQSAPPTRVLIDPQSGNVQTDLAGLATGGGIGVLATVADAAPSDVDLIAPNGSVNAGDAGIRASGNLNIAAVQVLNAGNIAVGGKSSGTPTASVSNVAGLTAASNTAGAASNTAQDSARQAQARSQASQQQDAPSIITVEVLGYGGGDDAGA